MKVKLKKCSGCGEDKPIWKNYEGERYCKYCWQLHNPKNTETSKPKLKNSIRQVSKKKKAKDIVYSELRRVFLNNNPGCEAKLVNCFLTATDVHHTFWGAERGVTYLEVDTWRAVCRSCHNKIHDELSAEESKALGLKNYRRNGN
tara:strand:- start:427 stop:861 length:435 start_codon:yes stop_codon:yes gene_type:complete